jgi:opacity protein-like surface antigen
MKSLLATALLTTMTATSAIAQVQFETRAFHSNLRIDAGRVTSEILGDVDYEEEEMSEAFLNTAGLGFGLIAAVDETVEFGLGVSFARYNPVPENELNQTVANGFTRINFAHTPHGKFYMLAGVSRQQLTQHFEGNEFARIRARYSPIVNGDLGLGASFQLDKVDIGFEYKYSNSLGRGRATLNSSWKIPGFHSVSSKYRIRDIVLEGQELALTCGIKL